MLERGVGAVDAEMEEGEGGVCLVGVEVELDVGDAVIGLGYVGHLSWSISEQIKSVRAS
jgi:hypothetical protein